MIKEMRIRNFKSFTDVRVPLSRVTFLIGANASGKSNALEVLRFASWMGHGDRLDDVERKFGKQGSIRGGVRDMFSWGQESVVASTGTASIVKVESDRKEFTIGFDVESKGSVYRIDQTIRNLEYQHLSLSDEQLRSLDRQSPLYYVKPQQGSESVDTIQVAWNNFKRGGRRPVVSCSNRRAVFQQMQDDDRFGMKSGESPVANASRVISKVLDAIVFLAPETAKMRGYVQIQSGCRIEEDGSNLSSVLFNICQNEYVKKDLIAFVSSLPEQSIRGVNFSRTATGDVMVVLKEGFGAFEQMPASLLSDGTLRALAIGAALFGAQPGSTVVIEEIDNGIHPSRAKRLVEQLYAIANARDVQIIMTTHNPALMDAVPREEFANVLCCYRDPSMYDSRICRLGDMPQYMDLAMRGSLGASAVDGELSRAAIDNRSEGDVRRQRMAWLEDFMTGNGGGL